jgi:ABC-type transport system substrate-binding protein
MIFDGLVELDLTDPKRLFEASPLAESGRSRTTARSTPSICKDVKFHDGTPFSAEVEVELTARERQGAALQQQANAFLGYAVGSESGK